MFETGRAAAPEVMERARERDDVIERLAEVCGQLNALHGELVGLLVAGRRLGLHEGAGLHAHGSWEAWRTGTTRRDGRALADLAVRADELPDTLRRLRAGEISLAAATAIARAAPSWAESDLAELALAMSPAQLTRAARAYGPPSPPPAPGERSVADDPDDPPKPEPSRVSAGFDDHGRYQLHADLDPTDGAAVDAALGSAIDAEIAKWKANGATGPMPDLVDAFLRLARDGHDTDAERRPHHRRTRIHLHVEVDHRIGDTVARLPAGAPVPTSVLDELGCDATWQIVFQREGRPLGTGRSARIPERLRQFVEARDGGCRCCGGRYVEIHHVRHRSDGGLTESWNLIGLCPRCHRDHHRGRIRIRGQDADDPAGITFWRPGGSQIGGVSPPRPPGASTPRPTATPYPGSSGERMQWRWWSPRARPPARSHEPATRVDVDDGRASEDRRIVTAPTPTG